MRLFVPYFRVAAVALLILSALMLAPMGLTLVGYGGAHETYLLPLAASLAAGLIFKRLGHPAPAHINQRQLFLITAGTWLTVPTFGMLPFMFMDNPLSLVDAAFETVSGMTTTGSTVMTGLEQTPKDILLWRSVLQWYGGIGIIGMTIAVLPSLKSGGMKLFRTESSDWSEKEIPQMKDLLKGIIGAYFGLSILCALAYWLAGMDAFNAINHMMTTVSTGGYSTSDASFGQFPSHLITWLAILFMFAGAVPFVLYIRFWRKQSSRILSDIQVKGLLFVLASAAGFLTIDLVLTTEMTIFEALTASAFNVMSVVTTTGYANANYGLWGPAAVAIFFFLTFVGGCSGSTSGGIKIFRFQLFFIMLQRQFKQAIHPNAVLVSKYGTRLVTEEILQSTIAFVFLLITTLVVLTLLLSLTGLDFITSITGASTALMNVGPGLGEMIGPAGNFQGVSDAAKSILMAGMILGRLEFTAIMIIFTRVFWRG
ncbi:TrkH family potassium uptake protein [Allohahella marinimesophila]|uniref:Trk system potassium uptake protein n=1 Tax=Allohahella marinimesophila TaxID=1054972 RepID=A0ABP7P2W1_9GAMM